MNQLLEHQFLFQICSHVTQVTSVLHWHCNRWIALPDDSHKTCIMKYKRFWLKKTNLSVHKSTEPELQLTSIRGGFIKDIISTCLTRSDAVLGKSKRVLGQFHSKPLWWKLIKCPAITCVSISPTPVPYRSMLYQRTRGLGNTICCQVRGHTLLVRGLSE